MGKAKRSNENKNLTLLPLCYRVMVFQEGDTWYGRLFSRAMLFVLKKGEDILMLMDG